MIRERTACSRVTDDLRWRWRWQSLREGKPVTSGWRHPASTGDNRPIQASRSSDKKSPGSYRSSMVDSKSLSTHCVLLIAFDRRRRKTDIMTS